MLSIGIDIGGTKIEVIIIDECGNVIHKERFKTIKSSYDNFLNLLIKIIKDTASLYNEEMSLGICLPGNCDIETGKIRNSNILVINGRVLLSDLESHVSIPISISNDANCFVLSEQVDGSASNCQSVFGVILGTGCGGGYVVHGKLLNGINACAGEWGHNPLPSYSLDVDGESTTCYCGRINCIESFISGTGLERQYLSRTGEHLTSHEIIELMRGNDPDSLMTWDLYKNQLHRCLASIVNMLDPETIVLGGGLSNVPEIMLNINQCVGQYVFGGVCNTHFVTAKHGDSSGIRGAAWMGRQLYKQKRTR
ncbi:ROK family protein [Providencia rettgeri]|uniref:ROK family protein n=1 Tax=Providencia rettgeri TaxID=587 RepID=A0AAD2VQG7_PRORE|nr:ROK family protein [Providencia rettgeri]ELR5216141.1 ROK family protein [Providencia rettgeri]UPS64507.1 ROK family protein [Providencia rettgeri]